MSKANTAAAAATSDTPNPLQSELTEALVAITASAEENDELRRQIAASNEALATTQREAAGLQAQLTELQGKRVPELPDDERMHAAWIEAGGTNGMHFETAKRFARALFA